MFPFTPGLLGTTRCHYGFMELRAHVSQHQRIISHLTRIGRTQLGSNDLQLQINIRLDPEGLAGVALEPVSDPSDEPSHEQLVDLASSIYAARRTRDRLLDNDLFGEPAWDMLLALYCLPARGERLAVTSLSHAANLPQSTGHRWQAALAERGLVSRDKDCGDNRRQFVSLTEKGRKQIENCLTRLFQLR